jgi:catechol 2,3-dioxygenase-like lactoylglutathione lyase family enzyme
MSNSGELDALISGMVDDYLAGNTAARTLRDALVEAGVGFWPVMDHLTIRTSDIDQRAKQFEDLGYVYSETLEFEDWYAKVYRLAGYPAMFIDQAYQGERGKTSLIPAWVEAFGDNVFHHIAVRVEDIEQTIRSLEARGVRFAGAIIGERGGDLRQIFSAAETVGGKAFSVLELTERHRGYMGFSPPQADALMKSSGPATASGASQP